LDSITVEVVGIIGADTDLQQAAPRSFRDRELLTTPSRVAKRRCFPSGERPDGVNPNSS